MFTGIIECIGCIKNVRRGGGYRQIEIDHNRRFDDSARGASIAVNGVCLTVERCHETGFTAQVLDETAARSTLKDVMPGDAVNLERALKLGDRLGGHIVQGHVDCVGSITSVARAGSDYSITVRHDPAIESCIVMKGSIALDGVSLTIAALQPGGFSVRLIQTTWEDTIFHLKKSGSRVNIETDIIGKYITKQAGSYRDTQLKNILESGGFLH